MTDADVAALTQQVLWLAFAISVGFGALVQRSGFCTMGAISDAAIVGDFGRLRQWGLAAATAVLGFAALAAFGLVNAQQTLYASTRWLWLSALVGGVLFGFGMVLASGCVSKSLVRVGGGNLKALVVVLVAAIAAFATLKGLTAVIRAASVDRVGVDLGVNADLGSLLAAWSGLAPATSSLVAGLAVGLALLAWSLAGRESRRSSQIVAGVGIGALVLAMWWTTGAWGHLAEHPQTLQETWLATNSTRAEGLSFAGPIAYGLDWLMFFSDANKRLTVGIVSVLGVVCGSAVTAVARGSFRWEGFGGTSDLGHHLVGGTLMGIGGITALGCSIGQGITGVSTLSLTSFVAVGAMVAGAVAGVKYQMWRVERLDRVPPPHPAMGSS